MRYLLILLLSILPAIAFAQSKADYQRVMNKFVKFYNSKKGDSVVNMFKPEYRKDIKWMWTPDEMKKLHEKYGTIKSSTYSKVVAGNGVNFETVFTKIEKNGSGLLLDKENHIESFALIISEPIDKKPGKTK